MKRILTLAALLLTIPSFSAPASASELYEMPSITAGILHLPQSLARRFLTPRSYARYLIHSGRANFSTFRAKPQLGNKYVRALPDLKGTHREAFDGEIAKDAHEPDEILYQAQRTYQSKPGNWFGSVKPLDADHADKLYNVRVWGNDAGRISIFRIKERVSGYHGKVSGGEGHQFYIPEDVPLEDVVEEVEVSEDRE